MDMEFLTSDPYDLALLATAVLLLLLGGVLLIRKPWRKTNPFPYTQKPFGSELHRSWVPIMQEALCGRYDIQTSVRLDSLLNVSPSIRSKAARDAESRLAGRCVDFLLLAPQTLDPLAVVLLQPEGDVDSFCNAALMAAGLAVVCLPETPVPRATDLRDLLQRELQNEPSTDSLEDWDLGLPRSEGLDRDEWLFAGWERSSEHQGGSFAEEDQQPANQWSPCPECGSMRQPRRVKSGRHAGKLFLVCERYPTCQSLQPLESR